MPLEFFVKYGLVVVELRLRFRRKRLRFKVFGRGTQARPLLPIDTHTSNLPQLSQKRFRLPSTGPELTLPSSLQLGAFDSLKHYIIGLPCDPAVAKIQPPLDDDAKWALFVKRSAWRFEKYWKGLEEAREQEGAGEEFKEEELPPLGS